MESQGTHSNKPGCGGRDAKARCIEQYRRHLGHFLECALKTLPTVKFDKHSSQHLAAICLYATIFQSVSECYKLIEEPTVAVPGILRSVLESYADLCAVIQNPDYTKKMLATFHDEQRKHLEDMIRSPANPFHADVAAHINPTTKLAEIQNALDGLRQNKHSPLSVFERFRTAGLGDLYRTVYWQLCLDAHNNVVALEHRHIRRTTGDDFEIDIFSENTNNQLGMYYDTMTALLIDSSRRLYALVGFSVPDEFSKLNTAFDQFRTEATPILTA